MAKTESISTNSSLRISSTEITIVNIDTSGKLNSVVEVPLPPQTITNSHITNPQELIKTISTAMSQAKLGDPKVILGIPEDKVYLSQADIPQTSKNTSGDSIRWQAEEVLPQDPRSLYFDWKKIPVGALSKALVIALPKPYLDPLIDAVVKAGLKPVSCEPTSLSLARLAPIQVVSILAEIRKQDSTIVFVDENKTPLLSTVVSSPERIADEVSRMTTFLQTTYQKKPTSLFICGEGSSNQWQDYLKTQTSLPVAPAQLPLLKNPPQNAQKHAVAISLAHKNPAPPHSAETINLIPPTLQKIYEQTAEKRSVSFGLKAAMVSTLITAGIMFAGLISTQLKISQTRTQIAAQEQAASQTSYSDLAKQAEAANLQARVVSRIPPKDNLRELISELRASSPEGIQILSFILDLPDNVLLVNGLAVNRNDLLSFKANLEANESFSLVTIPLPTLENQQNIQFSIAVDIQAK